MVASTRRSCRLVLDSRSNGVSQPDRRLLQRRLQPYTVSRTTSVDVEKATATAATNQVATGLCFSARSPPLATAPPLPEYSSPPLLLGCQACLKGKDSIKKPVVTYCGHLFCWRCLLDRLPPEGPLRNQVRLRCPVCEYPLVGGSRNKNLNSIIPIYRKGESPHDHLDSNEQPLPEPNAFPIEVFDEKIMLYHEVAEELKSAEESFLSVTQQAQEDLDSFDQQIQQILKSIGQQLSTAAEAKAKSLWHLSNS